MIVDALMLIIHLCHYAPEVILQVRVYKYEIYTFGMFHLTSVQQDLFTPSLKPAGTALSDGILLYCWYHNSLSHILVALNRYDMKI